MPYSGACSQRPLRSSSSTPVISDETYSSLTILAIAAAPAWPSSQLAKLSLTNAWCSVRGPSAHQNSACSPSRNQARCIAPDRSDSKRRRPCKACARVPCGSCSMRYRPTSSGNSCPCRVWTRYSLTASDERKAKPSAPFSSRNSTPASSSCITSTSAPPSSHRLVDPIRMETRDLGSTRTRSPSESVWFRTIRAHSLWSASKDHAVPTTSTMRPARAGGSAKAHVLTLANSTHRHTRVSQASR